MKVSNAITSTEKSSIIEAVLGKLCILVWHPRPKELIKEMVLSSKEEKHCVKYGWFGTTKRWSETTGVLRLTSRGVVEKITKYENYKEKPRGEHPFFLAFPAKIGGTEKTQERVIAEQEFPGLPEKYDLDPNVLQKIIDQLNQ